MSMLMNGRRSPSPRAGRRLMEVLGVEDFDRLFITEPPDAEGRGTEDDGRPGTQKGGHT